ncbi:MAG: hypothetical protein A3J54_01785 [Candidatus Ryanbacteria bacterium RIFCSPHIGHO2_02_FULL_45_13b]|uniref:Uncharacterized protein n=1 Tax=Candidatus Ryanbacteria bacterium RIFCSPHIGHO2_02_FULL_45_13b TaxID=1802117 RepID=A0A1G2GAN8_9BACT|nr:MAG: hypothetical protein A3J54_01785 [Candidatus Ryanbacteria bacterium RIFCSPHIGHO2_02_FULL_45_13b]
MSIEKPTTETKPVDPERQAKEERLQRARSEVESMRDREGKLLDNGIKETVVHCMALGLPTEQSCEGHLEQDKGFPTPWVSFKALGRPTWWYEGQKEIWEEVAREYGMLLEDVQSFANEKAYYEAQKREGDFMRVHKTEEDGVEEVSLIMTPEYQEWQKKNEALKNRLQNLMKEFNLSGNIKGTHKELVLTEDGDTLTLHPGAVDYQRHFDAKIHEEGSARPDNPEDYKALGVRLHEYQDEMKDFNSFLEACYFSRGFDISALEE